MAAWDPAPDWSVLFLLGSLLPPADKASEGDLEKNAKLWYQQVDPEVLGCYWSRHNPADPTAAAIDNMYLIMKVKGGKGSAEDEHMARKTKWEELLCVMENLEQDYGWIPQDGRGAYTSDESESHKSMVLGEYRHVPSC